jgi:hypothetical protein
MDIAALTACSVANRAAKGVLFLDPLNPADPALPQATVFPSTSVMVIIVLLKVECTWTWPMDKDLFDFRPPLLRVERTLRAISPLF